MIILDSNVLSGLMRDEPDARVVAWLDGQAATSIWITNITVVEIRLGLALLPDGVGVGACLNTRSRDSWPRI